MAVGCSMSAVECGGAGGSMEGQRELPQVGRSMKEIPGREMTQV